MEKLSRPKAPSADTDVSALLRAWSDGDQDALQALTPIVYDELHRLARHYMRRERSGHSLQATALVNEACIRLLGKPGAAWEGRGHFFRAAAQAMRQILIDHARARKRQKRGLGQVAVPLDEVEALMTDSVADELIALDEALERLAAANPRAVQVVERRFFGGLTLEETSMTLGVSLKTVQRDWLLARAWLRKEIDRDLPSFPGGEETEPLA